MRHIAFFLDAIRVVYKLFTTLSRADDNLIGQVRHIGSMKYKQFILASVAGFCVAVSLNFSTFADGAVNSTALRALAEKAVSENPTIASSAMANLRAQGPAGLEALLSVHAALILQHEKNWTSSLLGQQVVWQRLQKALNAVSAQHDCSASHLYWYTNFDEAKAAAKTSGKPILSLRLLGRLDE